MKHSGVVYTAKCDNDHCDVRYRMEYATRKQTRVLKRSARKRGWEIDDDEWLCPCCSDGENECSHYRGLCVTHDSPMNITDDKCVRMK